ncbi:ABC1 kinase family protein [Pontibacterium sp.]|uniref:ABC1 kinase family protein n=1 Tax=Pontibacterium sp. TaxID=2036026 RepID=UPI003512473F
MAKEKPLPTDRTSRFLKMGRIVGGLAVGALKEGANNLVAGKPLKANELLLTPENARELTNRLSEMRGAAMKVGQLLSMEAGDYLPPELTQVLAALRESATPMPRGQVELAMQNAWGRGWEAQFEHFTYQPIAAASIGQVHEAATYDGRKLALKIQYPGVRKSIDSDVDNVSALFRFLRLIPQDYDIEPLLAEAKQQLHLEADYHAEAASIEAYRQCIGADTGFELPKVDISRTTPELLTMSFVSGVPIETLEDAPVRHRNQIATRLVALVLREVFQWGLVQIDPHFGNYRYQTEEDRIGLLDFGATRRYTPEFIASLRRLVNAARQGNIAGIEDLAVELGYLRPDEAAPYRQGLCEMLYAVAEPLRQQGPFDFGHSDLSKRVAEHAISLRLHQRYLHFPPTDLLFLHRKFGGTYLLCARLKAEVDVNRLVEPYLH